jgi:hypothetical protein
MLGDGWTDRQKRYDRKNETREEKGREGVRAEGQPKREDGGAVAVTYRV